MDREAPPVTAAQPYIETQQDAEDMIYQSYLRAARHITETLDEKVRRPELTRRLLDAVGSPDRSGRYILVTGSKGKGSTARMISSLLSRSGLKVGLFTSPHLVDFKERIRIDGRAISMEAFIRYSRMVYPAFAAIESGLGPGEYQGPVGIALAIAALHFVDSGTDINIIECGRGGAFDDTNVIGNEAAVITPIVEEHVVQLGPDLADIVRHKLGIVKECTSHVYVGKQRPEVEGGIRALLAHRDAAYYHEAFMAANIQTTPGGTLFDVHTGNARYAGLKLPLLGEFQAINAALAVGVCEDILGGSLGEDRLRRCFSGLQWPGRCEIIGTDPLTVVDGAIHRDSARYLADIVTKLRGDSGRNVISIIGVPADKDYEGVMEVMAGVSGQLIVTKPDRSHLHFPEDGLEAARRHHACCMEFPVLQDALSYVKAQERSSIVVIAGTQTLVGSAKRLFGQSLLDIGR